MITGFLIISFILGLVLFLNRNRTINYVLLILFVAIQWSLNLYLFFHRGQDHSGFFSADPLALLMFTVLSIITLPALYHSYFYFRKIKDEPRQRSIYFAAMIFLLTAIGAAYLANHLAVMWVFVEVTTLSATALVYHRRNIRSLEGAWKYMFVGSVSITLVFIGILFLSIALQQVGYDDLFLPAIQRNAAILNVYWLKLSFIFIFTGFTVKMGMAPMHTAGIDAKDKAPSPAGGIFSSVLLNMGFVGIFRLYVIMAQTSLHAWTNHVLLIAAVLSVFIATVYMLSVKNIKRMLAYSSIEHMGIVTLGLVAGGIGYYAAILHLIFHAFAKSSLFFQVGQIYRIYQSKSIYDTGNYFRYNLTGAVVALLAFICLAAMPPSGMFISEFLIFKAMFDAREFFVLILVMILLSVIIWAFGKNLFRLLFTPATGIREEEIEKISVMESLPQFILLGAVFYLGLNPPRVMVELINQVISIIPRLT
jgi:hydrogenase-4 component F